MEQLPRGLWRIKSACISPSSRPSPSREKEQALKYSVCKSTTVLSSPLLLERARERRFKKTEL